MIVSLLVSLYTVFKWSQLLGEIQHKDRLESLVGVAIKIAAYA